MILAVDSVLLGYSMRHSELRTPDFRDWTQAQTCGSERRFSKICEVSPVEVKMKSISGMSPKNELVSPAVPRSEKVLERARSSVLEGFNGRLR